MEQTTPNEPNRKKKPIRRYWPVLALAAAGAVGGYFYYRFVGCASGACPITSNPYISTAYGGVIGALLGYIVTPAKKKEDS